MKYMNKRNGKVVELVNMDEKYKTVELREAGQEKTFTCTTSTFKRWYKKLEEQEVVEPMTDEQVEAQLLEQAQAVAAATESTFQKEVCLLTVREMLHLTGCDGDGELREYLDMIMYQLGFPLTTAREYIR